MSELPGTATLGTAFYLAAGTVLVLVTFVLYWACPGGSVYTSMFAMAMLLIGGMAGVILLISSIGS